MSNRVALRVFAQDGFRSSTIAASFDSPPTTRTLHEPAVQVGIGWR